MELFAELDSWADRIREHADGWRAVYVFFNHEDAGAAPTMALRMAAGFAAESSPAHPTTEVTPRWP